MLRRIIDVVILILVLVQAGTWHWGGKANLVHSTPETCEAVMVLAFKHAEKHDLLVNGEMPAWNLIVSNDLAKSIELPGVEHLQELVEPFNLTVYAESNAPPGSIQECRCEGCSILDWSLKWNFPLVAKSETTLWAGCLGANGFTNYHLFLFGSWIRISTHMAWVS